MHCKEGLLLKPKRKMRALSYEECHWITDLLKEGVPLAKALQLVSTSYNQTLIQEMVVALENGLPISRYFFKSKEEQAMLEFFLSLYSVSEALEHCLTIVDTKKYLKKHLLSKLVYPSVILFVSCACLLFVCFLVMPRVIGLIEGMGIVSDKGLYWFCIFLCLVLTGILLGLSLLSGVAIWAFKQQKCIQIYQNMSFKPLHQLMKFLFTFLFCSYLNVLLQRRVSTKEALTLLAGIEDGITCVIAIKCRNLMEAGKDFPIALWESGYITEKYYAILSLGDVSNQILKYSENYEKLSLLKLERNVKFSVYGAQALSYLCVALCAVVVMQLLMSPLQLFELL